MLFLQFLMNNSQWSRKGWRPRSQKHWVQLACMLLDSQQEALAGDNERKFVLIAQEKYVFTVGKNFFNADKQNEKSS